MLKVSHTQQFIKLYEYKAFPQILCTFNVVIFRCKKVCCEASANVQQKTTLIFLKNYFLVKENNTTMQGYAASFQKRENRNLTLK